MGVKTYRPYTETRRFQTGLTFEEITTSEPHKPLLEPKTRISGRNNLGQITIWHRGGGHQRHYRIIDFKRDKAGIPARVATVEYDPNRSAFISLLHYADGEKRYILYPSGLKVGDKVVSGPEADIVVGNALPLKNIPTGTMVHNIEMRPGKGGQLVRSAGGSAQLLSKEGDYAQLRLPSDTRPAELESAVQHALSELRLTEHGRTMIKSLSGGQRKRAAAAAELISKPTMLLLDEPTSGLDPGLERRFMTMLRGLADEGRGIVGVTHATRSLELCDDLADAGEC